MRNDNILDAHRNFSSVLRRIGKNDKVLRFQHSTGRHHFGVLGNIILTEMYTVVMEANTQTNKNKRKK